MEESAWGAAHVARPYYLLLLPASRLPEDAAYFYLLQRPPTYLTLTRERERYSILVCVAPRRKAALFDRPHKC